MARRTVQTHDYTYVFSSDGFAPMERQTWGLIRARLVDEMTGEPPDLGLAIETTFPNVFPRVAQDGLVGLAGSPVVAFPNLAALNYLVPIVLRAEGYVSRPLTVTVPLDPGFPGTFAVTDLGDVRMHRLPTLIRGRTARVAGNGTLPVGGATVRVTGLWRTLPPAHAMVPPETPDLVSLRPSLYADRTTATGRLRRRNITPVMGQDKRLLSVATRGSANVRLSDRIGLAAGAVLLIDALDPDRREIVRVATVDATSAADQPALVTLVLPLAYEHRDGVLARRATLQPAGATNALRQDALAGDVCVFLNTMSGLNTANVVEVFGGGPNEFHDVGQFTTTSDANGYYRLPLISRVAQLVIRAEDGVHTPDVPTYCPDYHTPENRLNFALR
jgi:hypothetical protein